MPANHSDPSATVDITIQGTIFSVPHRYVAGPIELSEGEAHALQQVLAENIRNNFATQMKKRADEIAEAEKNGTDVPAPLGQADLDAYSAEYQFGIRTGGGIILDPVGAEERRLVVAAIKTALAAKGQTWKGKTEEEQEALVARVIESGRFRPDAEAVVAAKAAAKKAAAALEL